MGRFLWLLRKSFNNKHKIFIISFAIIVIFLYFAPNSLFGINDEFTSVNEGNGYLGLFGSLLSIEYMLQYVNSGDVTMFDVIFYRIFPLLLFIIAIIGIWTTSKHGFLSMLILPFDIFAIYQAIATLRLSIYSPSWHAYAAIYILLAVILLCAVIMLLLSLYLPLKKPLPHSPRTTREQNSTKSERIAELERQIEELKRDNQKDT